MLRLALDRGDLSTLATRADSGIIASWNGIHSVRYRGIRFGVENKQRNEFR